MRKGVVAEQNPGAAYAALKLTGYGGKMNSS